MSDNSLSKCNKIAIIDTETNYDDEVISIGCAIVNARNYSIIDKKYYIVYPECTKPAMYSAELEYEGAIIDIKDRRKIVIKDLIVFLSKYEIENIFAYNASFDYSHLPEMQNYNWYDILKMAAYKQYNYSITGREDLYSTGRLKTGYGVEATLKRLCKFNKIKVKKEVHNALDDAVDEALVMELLRHDIEDYDVCLYSYAKKHYRKRNEGSMNNALPTKEVLKQKEVYDMFPLLNKEYKIKYFIYPNSDILEKEAFVSFIKTIVINDKLLYYVLLNSEKVKSKYYAIVVKPENEDPVIIVYDKINFSAFDPNKNVKFYLYVRYY